MTLLLGIKWVLNQNLLGKENHLLLLITVFFFLGIFLQNRLILISKPPKIGSLQFHLALVLIERYNLSEDRASHEHAENRKGISKYLMLLKNSELITFDFNFLTILFSHALAIKNCTGII